MAGTEPRRVLGALLCAAAVALAPPARAAATLNPMDMAALMQAMVVMARLWNQVMGGTGAGMGLDWSTVLGGGALPYGAWASQPWNSTPGGWGPMPPGSPGPVWPGAGNASVPGSSTGVRPGGAASGVPGAGAAAPNLATQLSGLWVAANGSTLWVQGERFILMRKGQILGTGTLRLRGSVLWMRDGRTGASKRYTAWFTGQTLTIGDAAGRSVTYRRTAGAQPR